MSSSSLGCAVGDDGNLLEETHIDFYNNPDDLVPISGPSTRAAAGKTRTQAASTLDSYITHTGSTHAPVELISGSRRSARIPRPSEKVRLAINATIPEKVTAGVKRRAEASLECTISHRRYTRASTDQSGEDTQAVPSEAEVDDVSGSKSDDASGCKSDDNDNLDEDAVSEAAYLDTKALGDADRSVIGFIFIFQFKYSLISSCVD